MMQYRKRISAWLHTAVPVVFLLPACDTSIDKVAEAGTIKSGTGA
ncbi:MAG: hypothetical protein WA946_15560 [Nitrospirota bacterium]